MFELSLTASFMSLVFICIKDRSCFSFKWPNKDNWKNSPQNELFIGLFSLAIAISVVAAMAYILITKEWNRYPNGFEPFIIAILCLIPTLMFWVFQEGEDKDEAFIVKIFYWVVIAMSLLASIAMLIIEIPYFLFVNFSMKQILLFCFYLLTETAVICSFVCFANYLYPNKKEVTLS